MNFWRNIKDLILSFYYPSGKFFLVSFPNSGRSWLMYMLNRIFDESKIEDLTIEDTHDGSEIIIEDGTRNNPNTLFRFTERYRYCRSKVIFLSRDPRDIITSNFHQVTKRAKNPFKFSKKSDFIRHDIYGFNRIICFFNIWFKNKGKPIKFLLVKYENLLLGTDDIKKIIRFLNIKVSDELIDKVYNESTALKMRAKEKNNKLIGFSDFGKDINALKVRNGVKGSYLKELSSEDIIYCNNQMKKLNTFFNYKI